MKNNPQFSPAVASLGYLDLARKDPKAALAHFEKAISDRPDDVGALFGRGQALLSLERTAEALAAFEAVLAVDPNQVDVRRRVDVLRFRNIEQKIADARQAAGAGRLEEAAHGFEAWLAMPGKRAEEEAHAEEVRGVVPAARHLVAQLRKAR